MRGAGEAWNDGQTPRLWIIARLPCPLRCGRWRAAGFKGACTRGIYDNMKSAVEAVFVDKTGIQPSLSACVRSRISGAGGLHTSLGMGEGSVENQVGLVGERFCAPRLRVKSYDELNAWLTGRARSPLGPPGADGEGRMRLP